MYRIGAAAVAIIGAVLVTAGCGSNSDSSDSHPLTKDEYIAAADEICTAGQKRIDEIPQLTTFNEEAFQTWRDEHVAIVRDFSTQLRDLTPPAEDAEKLDQFYDATDALTEKFATITFADFVAGTLNDEPEPTTDYGFKVCYVDDGS